MEQDELTLALGKRLEEIEAERGSHVALSDVAEVVNSLMGNLGGDITGFDVKVQEELRKLVSFIEQVKAEIVGVQPENIPQHHIPVAADELDAVVKATEEATGIILDAAEELDSLAATVDGEVSRKLQEITTKIYEASNFQDITGQRITKVIKALSQIESTVIAMLQAVGHDVESSSGLDQRHEIRTDEDLMNGPQLPDQAASQDDIDALFD